MLQELGLIILITDVVDDAGNVIAYTVSEEPVEGYETTITANITNSRTIVKLLKFQ